MNKAQAIQNFWSGFGLPAWDSTTVPTGDDAPDFPFITYNVIEDRLDSDIALTASLWYRSSSWREIEEKASEIAMALGSGGKSIKIDDGYLWLRIGYPYAQRMADDTDNMIRRIYLIVNAEFLTAY